MENILPSDILMIAWFFVLGAAIGSFLNVVIYRLPRGISLILPGSHCPRCNHGIRWFDNIPIFSWLLLGGKCRDCRATISAQYPAVEATTAGMFALLTTAEFAFRGINLPLPEIHGTGGAESVGRSDAELYGILLYHLFLLCTLLAAAVIEIERRSPPPRLFVPALAVGVIAPLICPYLRPMPAWPGLPDWTGRILDCVAGSAAGGLSGYMAWLIQGKKTPGGVTWGLLCVGIFLGGQAVCGVAFVISLLALLAAALGKLGKQPGTWPFSIWLYTVAFAWILAWSQIAELAKRIVN
jgi:leader peptidase (prepilin peptidase)/N-methyltransferase